MDPKTFSELIIPGRKNLVGSCVVCATGPRVGGGRAKKVIFFNLNLSIKFSILDNFPNDGSIFPTASGKISIKTLKAKKVSGGSHMYPLPPSFSS